MNEIDPEKLLKNEVISEKQIKNKVKELADKISADYMKKETPPILVGILRGAFVFLSDLLRELKIPAEVDFIAVSSYGASTRSSGVVRILKDLDEEIEKKHVIIIEDIVDTGLTLRYLLDTLSARNPASLEVCAFLKKVEKQEVNVSVKYVGFEIPDEFVVGYGLDYAERFRQLSSIYAIDTDKLK